VLKKFDNQTLSKIIDASAIYICACPAQVARELLDMRRLYDYQQNCLSQNPPPINDEVHKLIAATLKKNHELMEETLDRILTLEKWNRETYEMPEGLRQLRDASLTG
jgi:hypothetical protein